LNPFASPKSDESTSRGDSVFNSVTITSLVLSAFSAVLFYQVVTMLFVFPAANVAFMTSLMIVGRSRAKSDFRHLNISRLARVGCTSTVLLLVLPWVQLVLGIEFPVYRYLARLAELVLEAILW
jgi:hypothetical protein